MTARAVLVGSVLTVALVLPASFAVTAPSTGPMNEPPQILGIGAFPAIAGVANAIRADVADDRPNRLLTYTFHFGDGFSESGTARPGEILTSHSYAISGTYRLFFEVTDSGGASSAVAEDVFVSETDFLRVRTSVDIDPNLGVQGRVWVQDAVTGASGAFRDRWGLNWMKTSLFGIYPSWSLAFSDVPGYGTPPPQPYPSCGGSAEPRVYECGGVYAAHGFLRVITDPAVAGTIFVDDIPRNDWGMWTDLPPGTYTVSFGSVAGYDSPAPREVTVVAGQTTTTTGAYVPNPSAPGPIPSSFGTLRIVTEPGAPTQIEIDGVPRDSWGVNWLKLPPGCYEISFSDVPGLHTPAPTPACVTAGQVREVTGTFESLGWLRVVLSPALPGTISVNWMPFNDWGVWTDVRPGTYVIAFGHVNGYRPPALQVVSVQVGVTTQVVGQYLPVA